MVVWRCNYIIFLFSLWPEGPEKFLFAGNILVQIFLLFPTTGGEKWERKKKLKRGPFAQVFYMWKKKELK